MDLRQRDPFERKFAELIIRFRSIGFLLVLILLGVNGVSKAELYTGYLSEISSHFQTMIDFLKQPQHSLSVLGTHWESNQAVVISFFLILLVAPLFKKQWSVLVSFLVSAILLLSPLLFIHCGVANWLSWGLPLIAIVIAIGFKAIKFTWGNFLFVGVLGAILAYMQLGQLSLQLGIDRFILFPQWTLILVILASMLLGLQIWQLNQVYKDPKVISSASVTVQWYQRHFKFNLIVWLVVFVLLALGFIPSLGLKPIFAVFFLMAAFQMAVLHLVLFPMLMNVLGFFPKKS